MDAPAFDAKRFVRLALPTFVLLSMVMVQPAKADGIVVSSSQTYTAGGFTGTVIADVCEQAIDAAYGSSRWFVVTYYHYGLGGVCMYAIDPGDSRYGPAYTINLASCPANSTGTTPCTCNTGYQPDPTATSCVPVVACPAHASGTPCACDAGYEFDATRTSCISTCPVPALIAPPFNDACAQVLENINSTQAQKDATCGALTPALQTGKACFENKLAHMSPAIPLKITADIRDIAYQAHLREIWDKMEILVPLMKKDPDMQTACAARRAEIAAEKGCDNAGVCTSCYSESATQRSHCLKGMPARPSANDAQHTQGNAIDVSEIRTIVPLKRALGVLRPPQTIPQLLDAPTNCNLIWGGTFTDNYDPVHFLAR